MAATNSRKSDSSSSGSSRGRQWYLLVIIAITVFNVAVQIWIQNRCLERETIGDAHKLAFVQTTPTNRSGAFQTQTPPEDVCWTNYQKATSDRLAGITDEDVLRSKTYFGNRYRLAVLANALGMDRAGSNSNNNNNTVVGFAKKPIQAVVCGGSISLGHGVKVRYSDRLRDWLNDRFPVASETFRTTQVGATEEARKKYTTRRLEGGR